MWIFLYSGSKRRVKKLLIILLIVLIAGCGGKPRYYNYSLKDFKEPLRSHLQDMVTSGVYGYDSFITDSISGDELVKMCKSEHPVLRLAALNTLIEKDSNDYNLILENLHDTAIVSVDEGEFGLNRYMIADYLIWNAEWKNEKDFDKTVEDVVFKHNNLRAAYYILAKLEPEERYYSIIRKMASRERPFDETERSLYGLALYQEPTDISLIKEKLYWNYWKMSKLSFQLMRKFPDTSYLEVLKRYAISGYWGARDNYNYLLLEDGLYEDFCKTLAYYNADTSAVLFQRIIDRFDKFSKGEIEGLACAIYTAIEQYPSPLYKNILNDVVRICKIDTTRRVKQVIMRPKGINRTKPEKYLWKGFTRIPEE